MEQDFLKYNGDKFPIRYIADKDNPDNDLLIATEELLTAITSREDRIDKDAIQIDDEVFYYANAEEFKMKDEELFNHIINEQ